MYIKLLFVVALVTLQIADQDISLSHPEFDVYREQFSQDMKERLGYSNIKHIPIRFKVLRKSELGVCITDKRSYNVVYVNSTYWKRLPNTCRKALIYHELGHCALRQLHRNTTHYGHKLSLMHKNLLNCESFARNEKYYIDELFKDISKEI